MFYLWKSSNFCTSDFIASYFVLSPISSNVLSRASLRKRFVLIEKFKAPATGCDPSFFKNNVSYSGRSLDTVIAMWPEE